MKRFTRRKFLKSTSKVAAGAAATSVFAPNLAFGKKRFEGETMTVFVYSGIWGEAFNKFWVPMVKEQLGADMILDEGWWESIPKLKAAPPGQVVFDLIQTDATQGYPAINEGMFQNLNPDNIPNLKNVAPQILDTWLLKDNVATPWYESAHTGVYSKEMVKETPAHWGDLLRPEFDDKIGMYDAFYMSLFTFACMQADQEGRPGTGAQEIAENLDGVLAFAKEQSKRVNYWWPSSADMAFNMLEGNVIAGNIHGSDIFPSLMEGKPIGVFVPDDCRAHVSEFWIIPKATKKTELAEAAINIVYSVEFQNQYCRYTGDPSPILSVAVEIGKENPVWALLNPHKPEHFENVATYPYDAYFKDWGRIVEFWDKEVLRKG